MYPLTFSDCPSSANASASFHIPRTDLPVPRFDVHQLFVGHCLHHFILFHWRKTVGAFLVIRLIQVDAVALTGLSDHHILVWHERSDVSKDLAIAGLPKFNKVLYFTSEHLSLFSSLPCLDEAGVLRQFQLKPQSVLLRQGGTRCSFLRSCQRW